LQHIWDWRWSAFFVSCERHQEVIMVVNTLPVIRRLGLSQETLLGETAIITGAGGGIGYEAARALLWLGANVVIAEINPQSGEQAARKLATQFDSGRVLFVQTDVGEEASVSNLAAQVIRRFGKVDIVINNATIAVLGAVKDVPVEKWDASYRVNLRGPVLMARAFLPGMIGRRHGVFVCVSSTGTVFLGGYETFKAAQVHLANTLDAELEGSGVVAFTIGPGLVATETAKKSIEKLAPLMGMTVEEFFISNQNAVLSAEEAGAGFAAAVVFAEKFCGQEISSLQALRAADIRFGSEPASESTAPQASAKDFQTALALCRAVRATLSEQAEGWKRRSLFERQWVIRDFRKVSGMPVEEWMSTLTRLEGELEAGSLNMRPPLERLAGYYEHLAELAKGYEKESTKLQESLRHVYGWKDEVENLEAVIDLVAGKKDSE
jgi:NAD(P)-dependent dehydrogenase (short-subunit alcohol dehydrogenase family)